MAPLPVTPGGTTEPAVSGRTTAASNGYTSASNRNNQPSIELIMSAVSAQVGLLAQDDSHATRLLKNAQVAR